MKATPTSPDLDTIGKRVRAQRKALRMTQSELAALAGCTQQSIVQLEGDKVRDPYRILEIADALGVSPRYLKLLTDDPTPSITPERVRAELDDDLPPEALAQIWAVIQRHRKT
jgi:transcriptional regulator with XRE-family HTH domain